MDPYRHARINEKLFIKDIIFITILYKFLLKIYAEIVIKKMKKPSDQSSKKFDASILKQKNAFFWPHFWDFFFKNAKIVQKISLNSGRGGGHFPTKRTLSKGVFKEMPYVEEILCEVGFG